MTAPSGGPEPPRTFVSAPEEIGSGTLTPDHGGWRQVGGEIPSFTWVMAQVSGSITGAPNPACASEPPNWPCNMGPLVTPFAAEPSSIGPVQLLSVVGSRYAAVAMRAAGDGGVGLYLARDASTIAAQLALNNPLDQNPNPGGQIPSWIDLTGSFTVTLTAIPTPLTLTGGPTGDSAGTVSYTLGTVTPLRLSGGPYADEPSGAVLWRWVEGDSVPQYSVYDGAAWDIEQCRYQLSCAWTPAAGVNGRMEADAWVEGQYAVVRSDNVRDARGGQCSSSTAVSGGLRSTTRAGADLRRHADCGGEPDKGQSTLALSCNGGRGSVSVTRGSKIHCTASVTDGGIGTNYQWMFVDSAAHQISGPKGTAEWTGEVVTGGHMEVFGTVNGAVDSASATIIVVGRSWEDHLVPLREVFQRCNREELSDSCPLFYPPRVVHELAEGRPEPNTDWSLKDRAKIINDGGPNNGWAYISGTGSPIPYTEYLIHYSDLFQNMTDPFWQKQSDDCRTVGGIQDLFNAVQKHERLHYTMFSDIYGGAHDRKWAAQLEEFRGFGVESLDLWQQAVLLQGATLYNQMMLLSGKNHDYPNTEIWIPYSICRPDLPNG